MSNIQRVSQTRDFLAKPYAKEVSKKLALNGRKEVASQSKNEKDSALKATDASEAAADYLSQVIIVGDNKDRPEFIKSITEAVKKASQMTKNGLVMIQPIGSK